MWEKAFRFACNTLPYTLARHKMKHNQSPSLMWQFVHASSEVHAQFWKLLCVFQWESYVICCVLSRSRFFCVYFFPDFRLPLSTFVSDYFSLDILGCIFPSEMSFVTVQWETARCTLKYPLITEAINSGYHRNRRWRWKVQLGHPAHLPASASLFRGRSWFSLQRQPAFVQKEPWWYLWTALFGSNLSVCCCRQIRFSFMSMCHQKRKIQHTDGMTPPLLMEDPAQFQKILHVCASKYFNNNNWKSGCFSQCSRILIPSIFSKAPNECRSVWNTECIFNA